MISIEGTKLVAFDYAEGYAGHQVMRPLSRQLAGVEALFSSGWTMGPDALAQLLNDARARWWAGIAIR